MNFVTPKWIVKLRRQLLSTLIKRSSTFISRNEFWRWYKKKRIQTQQHRHTKSRSDSFNVSNTCRMSRLFATPLKYDTFNPLCHSPLHPLVTSAIEYHFQFVTYSYVMVYSIVRIVKIKEKKTLQHSNHPTSVPVAAITITIPVCTSIRVAKWSITAAPLAISDNFARHALTSCPYGTYLNDFTKLFYVIFTDICAHYDRK